MIKANGRFKISNWLPFVLITVLVLIASAFYITNTEPNPPRVSCPNQSFDLGYSTFNDYIRASPSIIIGRVKQSKEIEYKSQTAFSPQITVADQLKGDYLNKNETISLCPVLSQDAYPSGATVLIFLEGKNQDNLWSPLQGAAGIIPAENDEFVIEPWEKIPLSRDELKKRIND